MCYFLYHFSACDLDQIVGLRIFEMGHFVSTLGFDIQRTVHRDVFL